MASLNDRLQQAISSWPLWQPFHKRAPKVLEKFSEGLTNDSWLLQTDHGRAVLRLNSYHDQLLGIDRQREALILNAIGQCQINAKPTLAVAENGTENPTPHIAPQLWHNNIDQGFMVSAYVEGQVWQQQHFKQASNQQRLNQVLAEVQGIVVTLPTFNYWKHLCHYEQALTLLGVTISAPLSLQKSQHALAIQAFQQSAWQPVLVHHDLVAGNVIEHENGLCIIDWEYAAMGYGGFDVAETLADQNATIVAVIQQLMNDFWWLLKQTLP